MNVNNFFRTLFEDTLGLDVLGLDNRFADFVKLIDRNTLVTFSNLIPAKYLTYLDLSDPRNIVRKDRHTLGPNSSAYYSSLIASRQNLTLEGVFMGSEYTRNRTLIDSAIPFKMYKELRGPRTLYLRNFAYEGEVELTLKVPWPNIVSIPEEYKEILLTLCQYDIKIKLWNELKYVEDVVTPTGNLNLRMDWESAAKEREDYIQQLRLKTIPDRMGPVYFHIL